MKVKDLILITGGDTKVRMVGTTDKDLFVKVWDGIVDDIDFNNNQIPYGDYEIESVSVINGEDNLLINIDSSVNFCPNINADIKHVISGKSNYSISI